MSPHFLLVFALLASVVDGARLARRLRSGSEPSDCGPAAYAEWCGVHGDAAAARGLAAGATGSWSGEDRRAIFEQRCREVFALNARAGATWKASLNSFADRTDDELKTMLGLKRSSSGLSRHGPALMSTSFLSLVTAKRQNDTDVATLPESVDWRKGLKSAGHVINQGDCGSCWAIASAKAVEMHAEIRNASAEAVSADHLVQCVLNPFECGGSGGCEGATAELAFKFAQEQGILVKRGHQDIAMSGLCSTTGGRRAFVDGFVTLPPNRGQPLLEALATKGPLVVSVDATDWFPYESGIFDGCDTDAIVNHAVLMVGYEKNAYIIRNSWGPWWGERGHIRLLRLDGSGDGHCGVDRSPLEGVGCAGESPEVPVCGMCGVLQDVAYPVGVRFAGDVLTSLGSGASWRRGHAVASA